MSLAAACYALAAGATLAAAPVAAVLEPWVMDGARGLPPSQRARWALGMLALPWAIGTGVVLVTVGHCVGPMVLGGVDDCVPGLGLCVRDGAPVGRATVALSVLASLRPAYAVLQAIRGILASRRAARRLRAEGEAIGGAWSVPGAEAAVLGFPYGEVFVGEALREALTEAELRALLAHEEAHRRHHDLARRMLARVLASAHFDATGRALLAALDLALEQRCDAHASERVRDPLIVARAILQAASVRGGAQRSAPATLPARITALCEPPRRASRAMGMAALTALALAIAAAVAFDHPVHHAAESVLAALARS